MTNLPALETVTDPLPICPPNDSEISVRVACQPEEMKAAFRMIHQSYHRAGLSYWNEQELRVTPYQLEESSEILIALKDDELIATVSVIRDGPSGLPMEDAFPREFEALRESRGRIAEVSCLADRREKVERSVPVLLYLFKLLLHNARHHGVEQLLIAVHPRHVGFYERMIGFTPLAVTRRYKAVLDHPAVALTLDLDLPNENSTRAYRGFFKDPPPPERIVRQVPRCRAFIEQMRQQAVAQEIWEANETRRQRQSDFTEISPRCAVPA